MSSPAFDSILRPPADKELRISALKMAISELAAEEHNIRKASQNAQDHILELRKFKDYLDTEAHAMELHRHSLEHQLLALEGRIMGLETRAKRRSGSSPKSLSAVDKVLATLARNNITLKEAIASMDPAARAALARSLKKT